MIIGLSGLAGSGKSTVADRLEKKHGFVVVALADEIKRTAQRWYDFSDQQLWGPSEMRNAPDKRYMHRTSSPPEGWAATCGYSEDEAKEQLTEYLTPRYVLQFLGTEAGRHFYNNTWVDITLRIAKKLEVGGCYYDQKSGLRYCAEVPGVMVAKKNVVIPDVRFKNEILAIQEAGGKLVRILRPGAGLDNAAAQHRSETEQAEVPDVAFNFVLSNTSDLFTLGLLVDEMMDVLDGRIRPFDEAQENVPPFLRDKA